ncbi:tyrosine-type recombinase/integrase [Breoghania sp. L-A4]|uniref:tyrosine-type recombinase/integrase n=1 Tax=Breoghania sp. L-A4 TaxID=2304600 RepID=UPI000E3596FC|nr:tyrosine-type recombinase/integrase [Breoghania sp. L-A4]AXS39695.1 integrase [Breoghania sp. L-A4]
MSIVRIKGFQIFRDRFGKMRCYHRKSRTPVNLDNAPLGSAAFLAECTRINALEAPPSKPGTLGGLIEKYRASPAFLDLAPRTRSDYQRVFDYLQPIRDTPLTRFTTPFIVKLRDKTEHRRKRRFANYVRAVLSSLFSWGKERGYLKENPALGVRNVRKPKGTPDANRPWSDSERHAVLEAASPQMLPAIALMMFTGLGPQDALTLPRTFYRDGDIATRRSKTGEPVFWPAISPLRDALDAAPEHDAITLCANSRGRPWTVSGFRASWRPLRERLEKEGKVQPGLTLYGLRHTVAVILKELGYDDRSIADALGQKTEAMARHYSKGANLRQKMTGVAASLEAEVNSRRTKVVKPDVK